MKTLTQVSRRSLIAALLAAGAGPAGLPPAAAQQPPVVEAVIGNNFGHLPMFVGVEKGLFKKHGIDLKLKVVSTASRVCRSPAVPWPRTTTDSAVDTPTRC